MRIGYARISTIDQNLDLQRDVLKKAGCDRIFEDRESGARARRQGLAEALEAVSPGDTLVVWKLDRLGFSLRYLVETVHALSEKGVRFRSLAGLSDHAE